MISLIEREIFEKKLALVDFLFQHMNVEELQRTVDAQHIVDKLAGVKSPHGPLSTIWNEHQLMQSDIGALRNELYSFRQDFKMLIEAVDRPYHATAQMSSIKNRYQVY